MLKRELDLDVEVFLNLNETREKGE